MSVDSKEKCSLNTAISLREIQNKLMEEKLKNRNKLISQVSMGESQVYTPKLRGYKIYPAMKDIIATANSEVLLKFYKIQPNTDGVNDLLDALQTLNEKGIKSGKRIKIYFLINKRIGIASMLKPEKSDEANDPVFNLINVLYKKCNSNITSGLDIACRYHEHKAFGSFHGKTIVIDSHTALFFSGDLHRASNYKTLTDEKIPKQKLGQTELLSIIQSSDLVSKIRENFFFRWDSKNSKNSSKLTQPEFKKIEPGEFKPNSLAKISDNSIPDVITLFISKKPSGARTNLISPYGIALILAIDKAKNSVDIMTPNLNHPEIIKAIANAALRTVAIRIILGKTHNDREEKWVGGTNLDGIKSIISEISRKNKKALESLHIRWVADDNGNIVKNESEQRLHVKYACIDGRIVFVGSSVCDVQSIHNSEETDLIFDSTTVASKYDEHIFYPIYGIGIPFNDFKMDVLLYLQVLNKNLSQNDNNRLLRKLIIDIEETSTPAGAVQAIRDFKEFLEVQKKSLGFFDDNDKGIAKQACEEVLKIVEKSHDMLLVKSGTSIKYQ